MAGGAEAKLGCSLSQKSGRQRMDSRQTTQQLVHWPGSSSTAAARSSCWPALPAQAQCRRWCRCWAAAACQKTSSRRLPVRWRSWLRAVQQALRRCWRQAQCPLWCSRCGPAPGGRAACSAESVRGSAAQAAAAGEQQSTDSSGLCRSRRHPAAAAAAAGRCALGSRGAGSSQSRDTLGVVVYAVVCLYRMIVSSAEGARAAQQAGVHRVMMRLLQQAKHPGLRATALAVLAAAGTHDEQDAAAAVEAGALEQAERLLASPYMRTQRNAAVALRQLMASWPPAERGPWVRRLRRAPQLLQQLLAGSAAGAVRSHHARRAGRSQAHHRQPQGNQAAGPSGCPARTQQ
jgi:hypothetical protein